MHNWHAPTINGAINSTLEIPGSKSATNRAFVLAALGDKNSIITNPLFARDTNLMLEALEKLGCNVVKKLNSVEISPMKKDHSEISIDVGLAGTVMRFVPPLAALSSGTSHFDGDERARNRPMKTLIESLKKLNVKVIDNHQGKLPFSIISDGQITGGEIEIDASESSQFISALMLVGAKFKNGLTIKHVGQNLPSLPHIEMTIEMLKEVGVKTNQINTTTWRIDNQNINSKNWVVEPDLSNAGPFLAAAMVTKGEIKINDWPLQTTQAGNSWIEILSLMGANIQLNSKQLILKNDSEIKGINYNLNDVGELTPVLVAISLFANSKSEFTGISHLRGHETDRLAALVENITAIGGDAKETEDGLIINPKQLHGGVWKAFDDHRMATAGAVIGLKVKDIYVDDIATTSKTLPNFEEMWNKMVNL
ncbi:MAG: 3-phosphoshikimate 1-carboxyvinyltransferase [Actinobacteria bacterium]|nr:3-phosphoshikimate 1-carboxyvinyltransferase [Actinomycetota bacterium]